MREIRDLPKANLHLHLTGSMRRSTAVELAARHGLSVPPPLPAETAVGWPAFQDLYDSARAAIRTAEDIARVVSEAIADNASDGAGWLEIQVDPTSYAPRLGGLEPVIEALLGAMIGTPTGLVLAASWGPHRRTRSTWRNWRFAMRLTASSASGCRTTNGRAGCRTSRPRSRSPGPLRC